MKITAGMACPAVVAAVVLALLAARPSLARDAVQGGLDRTRGLVISEGAAALAERHAKLEKLAEDASLLARRRARLLYRIIRARDAALSAGAVLLQTPLIGEVEPAASAPAAAVSIGLTALARDLEEARALAAEAARAEGRIVDHDREPARDSAGVGAGTASCLWPGVRLPAVGANNDRTLRLPARAALALRAPMDGLFQGLPPDPDGRALSALAVAGGWTFLIVGLRAASSLGVRVKRGDRLPWTIEKDDRDVELELWRGGTRADPRRACGAGRL